MFVFYLITGLYLIFIFTLIYGWKKLPEFTPGDAIPSTRFSIIIPYRNEVENLPALLKSFSELSYPRENFEILLVNDDSGDDSKNICTTFAQNHPGLQIKLLQNQRSSGSPKKDAITTAINTAQNPWIITTDADCLVPKYWLKTYNDFIQTSTAKLIAAPVSLKDSPPFGGSRRGDFELLDFLSLQATTIGAFGLGQAFISNAANMCYLKSAFEEVSGYTGNENIASGDDVFLLQKFQKRGFKTAFLKAKSAVVLTKPQPSWKHLFSQRIRWASKTPAYTALFPKILGLTVALINLSLVLGASLALFQFLPWFPIALIFLLKFNADFALLYLSADFLTQKPALRAYFWSSLLYPIFSTAVAFKALTSGYKWKGREY